MNACTINDNDHAPFSMSRTSHALFDQTTEGFRISFLGTNAHDRTRAPICGGTLVTLGRMDTGSTHFVLAPAQHPHPRQSRKQTQFRFILNVDIGAPRRML
jgi:galactose-1-phosphate uridylyltransferase